MISFSQPIRQNAIMSDESDIEDRVASETEEELDEELDEVDSEESDSEAANEFLDLEASESEGESDDEDDLSDIGEPAYFHKFMELPPELRARIWEVFDEELRLKSRVYPVRTMHYIPSQIEIYVGEFLEGMVERTKIMMSVHRESRALALTFYPDMFYLHEGRYGVPYNKERDVVLISGMTGARNSHHIRDILSALGNPQNVALAPEWALEDEEELWVASGSEGTPKNLLLWSDEYSYQIPTMEWCVSDIASRYLVEYTEEISGLPRDEWILYCWPDFELPRQLLSKSIPQAHSENQRTHCWPIIEFRDHERFLKFKDAVATEGEWADKWSRASDLGLETDEEDEEEEEEEDGFESDGIDDDTIDEDEGSSEDEDDLVVVQSDSEDDSASTFDGFSPLQPANSEHGDEMGAANFSSPEPEPTAAGGSTDPLTHTSDHDSEHALSDEEPVQSTSRHKRRIISSDDENEDEDEPNEKVKVPLRPNKRSRVVLSDSEDEEDRDSDEDVKHNQAAADGPESDEEEEEESDDSEDEEAGPSKAKPMSLFEKLKKFRDENPVSPASGDGSDVGSDAEESMNGEDFDDDSEPKFLDDEADEDEVLDNDEGESYEDGDDEW